MRVLGKQIGAESIQRIKPQRHILIIGQGTDYRPILTRFFWWETRPHRHLWATFGINEKPAFLGITGRGQNHIGAVCATIAVATLINHELIGGQISFIRAQIINHIGAFYRPFHPTRGGKTNIHRADSRGGGV